MSDGDGGTAPGGQGTPQQNGSAGRRRGRELARARSRDRLEAAWVAAARQRELARKREQSRKQKAAEQAAAWKQFMQRERREIELRRDGQLADLLGDPLPGEIPTTLQRLAAHDRRQAEQGLVALMSGGNTVYKDIDDLGPEDMPARIAANRLRTSWLKGRRDTWLGHGETSP